MGSHNPKQIVANFVYLSYLNSHKNIVIIGGGLAALCSAIHLANANIEITIIEKDTYPRHKVCGEYISNEVLPYLDFLQLDVASLHPTQISRMQISTSNGKSLFHKLPLGGFGVSRFKLDHYLYTRAKKSGVEIIIDQVVGISRENEYHNIQLASDKCILANIVIGAYGKRSVLDRNLSRDFHQKNSPWLAVKAHYKADLENDLVALHNFEGGYCGLSKVEYDLVNACYLVNYNSFKRYKDIHSFQKNIMSKNPHLQVFFEGSQIVFEKPLTISQINFSKKRSVEQGIFMIGDAAGLIHPLCGNGMAMAIQGAKIISELIIRLEQGEVTKLQLEKLYNDRWKQTFSKRLYVGRLLQHVLLNSTFQNLAYQLANSFPGIVPEIVKQTHGKPMVCS